MIYTVTLNPSVDFISHVRELKAGRVNHSVAESMNAGGRALNISRILTTMNVPTTTTGFIGGRTGAFIKDELDRLGIAHDFIEVQASTRLNLSLFVDEKETRILGPGSEIHLDEVNDLMYYLSRIREGDFLVLAGSLPPKMNPDIYNRMVEIAVVNGASFLPIIQPEYLMELLPKKPLLIAPTVRELAQLFDANIQSKAEAAPYLLECLKLGAQNVIVNFEREGSLFADQDGNIYESDGPQEKIVSQTYTGIALVAGFIGNYMRTNDPLLAFTSGQGVSNATYYVDSLPSEAEMERVTEQVSVLPFA